MTTGGAGREAREPRARPAARPMPTSGTFHGALYDVGDVEGIANAEPPIDRTGGRPPPRTVG